MSTTTFPIPVGGPHATVRDALDLAVAKVGTRLISGELRHVELRALCYDHETPDEVSWPLNLRGRRVSVVLQLDEATRTRITQEPDGRFRWHVRAAFDVIVRDDLEPGRPKSKQRQSDAHTEAVKYIEENLDPEAVSQIAEAGHVGAHGICFLRHCFDFIDKWMAYDVGDAVVAECRRRVREGVNFRAAKPDEETFERPKGFTRDVHETVPALEVPDVERASKGEAVLRHLEGGR